MEYLHITADNIDHEHVCCAMSNKQSLAKKEWLKQRFQEGLVFYRSVERGKCFIEFIPAEYAWAPIEAPGYLFVDCLWVSGSLKGKGYANDLLDECIASAKAQAKQGVCIVSSHRKKEFLSDARFLTHKGFVVADEALNGITLMCLPLREDAVVPSFKPCAKQGVIDEKGYVIFYTDQCPFTHYWVPRVVEVAKEYGIEVKAVHVTDRATAQCLPCPVSTYALFRDGSYVTHGIQSDKKFLKLAGIALK